MSETRRLTINGPWMLQGYQLRGAVSRLRKSDFITMKLSERYETILMVGDRKKYVDDLGAYDRGDSRLQQTWDAQATAFLKKHIADYVAIKTEKEKEKRLLFEAEMAEINRQMAAQELELREPETDSLDAEFKRTTDSERIAAQYRLAALKSKKAIIEKNRYQQPIADVVPDSKIRPDVQVDIELSGLQRDVKASYSEVELPVKRGDYSQIVKVWNSDFVGGVVTGPTGCGKSTVAMTPLFKRGVRVLIIEPSAPNVANIMHEYTHVMPSLHRSGVFAQTIPPIIACDVGTDFSTVAFGVISVSSLLTVFRTLGRLPRYDVMVLDEFHLPIQDMVTVLELIRSFKVVPKYLLVSATAPGLKVHAELPSGCQLITQNRGPGWTPAIYEYSYLDPRSYYMDKSDNFAIVAPSEGTATKLAEFYRSIGKQTWLITRSTTLEDYAAAVVMRGVIYVLEPAVEAGITLHLKHLVDMGTSVAIRFDGKVVVEDEQPLDTMASIQRASRGGRLRPTQVWIPGHLPEVPPASSALFFRANSIVEMLSYGANMSLMYQGDAVQQFPKLSVVSVNTAKAAMRDKDSAPLVSVYRINDSGQVYKECGGIGTGFSQLARNQLYLYHWDGGFFIAPVADFSMDHSTPQSFVGLRSAQLSAAKEMVATRHEFSNGKISDTELCELMLEDAYTYAPEVVSILKRVLKLDGTGTIELAYSDPKDARYPELSDLFRSQSGTNVPLLLITGLQSRNIIHVRYKFDDPIEKGGKMTFRTTISIEFRAESVPFEVLPKFVSKVGNKIDVAALSQVVTDGLSDVMSVELLKRRAPDACVDLKNYIGRVSENHTWFRENVVYGALSA